jgi:4,5-DOPA dioxygenase extradiol
MPVAFFGHGTPLNALSDNEHTRAWARFGAELPPPRAILVVSAHWYVPGTKLTAGTAPRTVHDFGAWAPPELFGLTYGAPGSEGLVARVQELLGASVAEPDANWGFDHGAWSVLVHAFPQASTPVVQLSIDRRQPPAFHYALGAKLAPLRDEGILVIGSGNVVHNLELFRGDAGDESWAPRFERCVRDWIVAADHDALIDYHRHGADAWLSIPTPDHYLPLLYVVAQQREDDPARVITEGTHGAMGMLSVALG